MPDKQPIAIGLDMGTGGARAVAVDLTGRVVARGRSDIPADALRVDGPIVEQDPKAWIETTIGALGQLPRQLPEDAHADFFVGDMARWWVETKPQPGGPLFLQIGFPGPHPPYDPIPRYAEPYLERDLPLPTVTERELAAQPPPFLAMRQRNTVVDHDFIFHLLDPSQEQQHRQRAYYLANVTMIDEKIGEIENEIKF